MDVAYLGSVPEDITVFIETTDVTNTLRNAVSLGGDTDTIPASRVVSPRHSTAALMHCGRFVRATFPIV